jgi:hypothetical protein
MRIHLVGKTPGPIWVSMMTYAPDICGGSGGGDWYVQGWWRVDLGRTIKTSVDTDNRYLALYAEASDGRVWGGPYGPVDCPQQRFQACIGLLNNPNYSGLPDRRLGFRLIDGGAKKPSNLYIRL